MRRNGIEEWEEQSPPGTREALAWCCESGDDWSGQCPGRSFLAVPCFLGTSALVLRSTSSGMRYIFVVNMVNVPFFCRLILSTCP